MKKFNTLVYWSLLRLQKQNRLLCDRTILHSEEQLWNKTEGTEAPQLHETTHTTSSTQQRYIHLFKKIHTLVYWSLLRLQKKDYSVIEQFCISRSSYELFVKIRKRDTHLHETSHTTSSTQQRCIQLHKKLQNPGVLIITKAAKTKQNRLLCNRTILHFEEQLWTIGEDTEARHISTQNIAHY